MKLGPKAIAIVEKWGAFTDDRHSLHLDADRFAIQAELVTADSLSCSLSELGLVPHTPLRLAAQDLKAWGERLATRVRYLLEAIETVEHDTARGRLLLRSTPPDKAPDGSVSYYELLLESTGQLRLGRQRYDAQTRIRTAEPLHCTRQLLAKLIDDLVATAP